MQFPHTEHTEPVQLLYRGHAEMTRRMNDFLMISACHVVFGRIRVPKVYKFTFLLGLSVEMAFKTKGGMRKRSKKGNVDISQGSCAVMVWSPWDCGKIITLYLRFYGHYTGIVRQPCDSCTRS